MLKNIFFKFFDFFDQFLHFLENKKKVFFQESPKNPEIVKKNLLAQISRIPKISSKNII